jgi:hypothetical protein
VELLTCWVLISAIDTPPAVHPVMVSLSGDSSSVRPTSRAVALAVSVCVQVIGDGFALPFAAVVPVDGPTESKRTGPGPAEAVRNAAMQPAKLDGLAPVNATESVCAPAPEFSR